MKSLKILSTLFVAASLVLMFASCSKKNDSTGGIPKEQLAGKWTATMIAGNINQEIKVDLNANGVAGLDAQPYDGIPELTGTWELNGANFVIHIGYMGNPDFAKFDAIISSANSISGKLVFGGQMGTFTMNK